MLRTRRQSWRQCNDHSKAQNLYEAALKRGMAHIGTLSFGRCVFMHLTPSELPYVQEPKMGER